ncbi:hypothetical protein HPB52_006225 [Rhipicephalus sanguineus]|uniref:Uncharacterized protein n=1 Tax=Rhipicephalus sanguineus TaxID=34632 RepID=A0A9D4SQ97_RHISA|nr:hypothetical protein HPB52_006225 [Rhipicephalus sanguineus]
MNLNRCLTTMCGERMLHFLSGATTTLPVSKRDAADVTEAPAATEAVHAQAMEGVAGSCRKAAPMDGDGACADESLENVNAELSTAAVEETSRKEADDFRGGEEETGECQTTEPDVAGVSVAADAVGEEAAQRDSFAYPEGAADDANGGVEKENKKRKKKSDHDGRRSNPEATEQAGDEKCAEVDEVSVGDADVGCHDG